MTSKREEVLLALLSQLRTIPLIKAERNRMRPERVPPEGLLILRDGDLGEPEVLLSPLIYVWTHAARVELYSGSADPDAHMDALLISLGEALNADPSLGGLVDLMDIGAPDFDSAAPDGGPDIKAAVVPIRVTYETSHPLT